MAQFRSALRRNYWLGVIYSAVLDFLVALFIATFFQDKLGSQLLVALLLVLAVWLFQLAYSIFGAVKAAVPFYLFEQKARVASIVDQMAALKMPKPNMYHADAAEYFAGVVKSQSAGGDARLMAGSTIGFLEALRTTQRLYLTLTGAMVLEESIQQYGRRVGFEDEADGPH